MGTGYTRNDTANNIADGNVINASDLDGEFDAIQAAFNASTGHSHDGTTGEGPQIGTGGIADNAVTLGTKTSGNYVATIATSAGLDGSASSEGATPTISLNLNELTTSTTDGDGDYFVVVDTAGTQRKLTKANIAVSGFNTANGIALGTDTTGNYIATGAVSGVGLSGSASAEGATFTVSSNATDANTASTIVARDASGNFSAGTITAALTGTASNAALLDSLDSTQFLRSDAADTKTSGDLSFSDNVKAVFGAGSDLQIYHNGSASFIQDVGTGPLYIDGGATGSINLRNSNGETMAAFIGNGAVQLYYDNNLKLVTTSGGIDVTGTITFDGGTTSADLNFGDNDKAVFGAGSDMQIYHDGSNSIITEQGTGDLIVYTNGAAFQVDSSSGENMIYAARDAGVNLYHNNNVRIQSTNAGATITGTLTVDGLSLGDNEYAYFGAGNDLQIYHDGSHSYINDAGTGSLYVLAQDFIMRNSGNTAGMIYAVDGGAVSLYYNGSLKFQTTSAGATVTGTLTADGLSLGDNEKAQFGAGNDLQIYHDGNNSIITDTGTGDLSIRASTNLSLQSATNEYYAQGTANGAFTLYYDNSARLATHVNGIDVTGDIDAVDRIFLGSHIFHEGDTDTYMQFHNANEWRVVTGGTEMLEVNNDTVNLGANTVGNVHTANITGGATPNFEVYNSFVWTLTGNVTLNNPTTELTGMSGVFIFIHSGAARTVSLGTDWETAGGAGLTLSSTAGAVDIVPYFVQAGGNILLGTPQLAFS
jgi:hypothetical protein